MNSSTTHTFDTLQYAKRLQKAGFTVEQSEAQAEAIKEILDDKLATKSDIRHLKLEMHHIEERLTNRIHESVYRTIISLGGIMVAGITVLGILNKF